MHTTRYIPADRFTGYLNRAVRGLTKLGISLYGSRVLSVRGRKTGQWRSTPVNPLNLDGTRYLVAPRGNTEWVRNLRATGFEGQLRIGRRVELFTATEIADDDKPAILRAYLKKWKFEVGMFFDGVDATAPDTQLRDIAPGYPVFRITPRP
jgi:deazaflavin-dependent oxidoreductase (nitroreductase family)